VHGRSQRLTVTPEEQADAGSVSEKGRSPFVIAVAVVALAALLASVFLLGISLGPSDTTKIAMSAESSVDAGFAGDMQRHHAQAVEMSNLVLQRTSDAEIRTLATDILLTQQQQIGQMYAWLELWSLPQSSSQPAMAWMPQDQANTPGHDMASMGSQPMPGMATSKDLAQLAKATGTRANRLYLQLMIPHHQGALDMATAAAQNAETSQVKALAQAILDSQTAELAVLRQMLAARGGPITG